MRLNLVNLPSSRAFQVLAGIFLLALVLFVLMTLNWVAETAVTRVLRAACIAVDAILAAAFLTLLTWEQLQDRVLFRKWQRERAAGRARVRATYVECAACGCRRNREYDRNCLACGSALKHVAAP